MISIDLLVNLVVIPIGFLLLVVLREWLHRLFLAPASQRGARSARRNIATPVRVYTGRKSGVEKIIQQ